MKNKAETLTTGSSQPEVFNVLGQLQTIERVKKSGEMIYNKKEQLTNDSDPNQNKFNFVFLGQSVLKYQVPLDVYNTINHIYETKYPELKPANKQLVGKIEKNIVYF